MKQNSRIRFLIIGVFLLLVQAQIFSEWKALGPENRVVKSITVDNSYNIVVSAAEKGLLLYDNGKSDKWYEIPLPVDAPSIVYDAKIINNDHLFAILGKNL